MLAKPFEELDTLRELLFLIAAPVTTLVGLAAFTAWWTATMFLAGIAVISVLAVRHHEKHNRPDVFDDRLSAERMQKAREWLLEN